MTELVPSTTRHSEVAAILERVEREGIMEIDAQKETRYAKQLDGRRFAIVDDSNAVVGYLSGGYSGGWAPSPNVAREDVVAFVSLIVIDKEARGEGHAFEAIKQFAARAQNEKSAKLIGLNLDQSGDVDARQASFEHMGFAFVDAAGVTAIGDLLQT
jgi:ribosomal protein S18 acetylase RimI-like enzyme